MVVARVVKGVVADAFDMVHGDAAAINFYETPGTDVELRCGADARDGHVTI